MGKTTKKKALETKQTDDDKQRKISSFFENKTIDKKKESSKLFTSISNVKRTNAFNSKVTSDAVRQKPSFLALSNSSKSLRTKQSASSINENITEGRNAASESTKNDDIDSVGKDSSVDKEVICVLGDSESGDEIEEHVGADSFTTHAKDAGIKRGLIENNGMLKRKEQTSLDSADIEENLLGKRIVEREGLAVSDPISDPAVRDESEMLRSDDLCSFATPLKWANDLIASSPDVICNTPGMDGSLADVVDKRYTGKQSSRSFLRSFHLVSIQPDLKPAHMRINAKRKANKTIGPVSVNFTAKTEVKSILEKDKAITAASDTNSPAQCDLELVNEKFGNKMEDLCNGRNVIVPGDQENSNVIEEDIDPTKMQEDSKVSCQEESAFEHRKNFVSLLPQTRCHLNAAGSEDIDSTSNPKLKEGDGQEVENEESTQGLCIKENVIDTEVLEECLEEITVGSQPTPTKIYNQSDIADLIRIKRQAKSGLSPLAKRQTVIEKDNGLQSNLEALEKVKRNLNKQNEVKMLGSKDDLVKNSTSVQCKSKKFTVKKAEELGWKGTKTETKTEIVTLRDDDVLGELLKGLQPCSDNGREDSVHQLNKCSKKKKTKKSCSHVDKDSNMSHSLSVPSDDIFLALGMDLPKEMKQQQSSDQTLVKDIDQSSYDICIKSPDASTSPNQQAFPCLVSPSETFHPSNTSASKIPTVATNPQSHLFSSGCSISSNCNSHVAISEYSPESGNVSHQSLSTGEDRHKAANDKRSHSLGSWDEMEKQHSDFGFADDLLMLALEVESEVIAKQTESEKLACSFGALSPFKTPKEVLERSTSSKKKEFRFTDLWQRFKVIEVIHDSHADETYLTLCGEKDKSDTHHCTLRGFWVDTKIIEGDVVNVVGQFDNNNSCTVDDRSGLIVVSPDLLLSGTSVVSSVFCARKSVLNEKFKGLDQGNVQMLYGSIIHSLFQTVLKEDVRRVQEVMKVAKTLLATPKFLHAMYSQGVSEIAVMEEIELYVPPLMTWLDKHLAVKKGKPIAANKHRSGVLVTGIQDIEENIWSPRFGLKGKIDLTVKVELPDRNGLAQEKILPLELKTGKASFSSEHKGQVTLYSMMYGDRRDDPGEGLLLYLKHCQMDTVLVKPQSKSGLIQLRNNLASFVKNQVSSRVDSTGQVTYSLGHLPKPINNERACTKCPHLLNCCIYQRSVETSSLPESHPMNQLVPDTLSHLGSEDLEYFTHWLTCLQMEEQHANQREIGHIWTMGSAEREAKGDCLSQLLIQSSELGIPESQVYNEGKGCSLTFVRHHGNQGMPMNSVGFTVNDIVVVSSEDGRLIALATGFIRTLSAKHVEVVVDRDNLFDISAYQDILFRLDRYASFSTSGQLMGNLTRLMDKQTQASRLRDLIIRKRPPQSEMKIPMNWVRTMKPVFKQLNKPQKTAILKVLMSTDYTLIRGFPGSGKTSTIVALVKVLHLLNKSVLLTSYTHSAVDNILLKLKQDNVPFLRLGRQARIHPSIHPHSAEILTSSIPSVDELKTFYNSYNVIATTCLGVTHTLFNQRRFDVCIVDEASQVLQPACFGPLFHCQKFVLVGDAKQLAPVVLSTKAKSLGMDESLFLRLENNGATLDLHLQYRMNRVIMDVSNRLVYAGRLECGNNEVAEQSLQLELSSMEECQEWMKEALSPELSKSVVFLDTQKITGHDSPNGPGIRSGLEADIVVALLERLHKANVSTKDIGVMSPYRAQVKLLQRRVHDCPLVAGVEVNTIDQYQGRDKNVILVSFAWRNEMAHDTAGLLLEDIRRLNVAVTRARHKLILVGDSIALRAWPLLENMIDDLLTKQCVMQLPSTPMPVSSQSHSLN